MRRAEDAVHSSLSEREPEDLDTVIWVGDTRGGWHDVQSYEGLFASEHLEYGEVFQFTFAEGLGKHPMPWCARAGWRRECGE